MIKPNWDIFKYKSHSNPQANFEWFCYLLFCKKFNKHNGILRYKNQSAIENEPITTNNEVIGWQAKFYDTPLSSHKKELLETLERAKRSYPEITKIIFYTNQEWAKTKDGQKPKGFIEIEEKAKKFNIEIEWCTASFFESLFVCNDNEKISKHFFTLGKSIFDQIEEQQKHTENILKQVKTEFNFADQVFSINRDEAMNKLKDTKAQVTFLSGAAGVGKTVIIKKYYEEQKDNIPFYVFKSAEFTNLRTIQEFDFYKFINAHKDEKEKIIVIDSAEKLLDIENKDPFKKFLSTVHKNGWKIIFTTRDSYVDVLNTEFLDVCGIINENIYIQNLTEEELIRLSEKYRFDLPTDKKLFELIKNLFYLNEYLKHYKNSEMLNYTKFKENLWNNTFQSKPNREQCFLEIAFDRAKNGQFYIIPQCISSILSDLLNIEVLGYESPYGYFITHDIYEEWALEKIIEREFLKKDSVKNFFTTIGNSLPIRRSFRNWLSEKLLLGDITVKQFVENAMDSHITTHWKDEILISVLLSDYSSLFFQTFKEKLIKNKAFLEKIVCLLKRECREIDYNFFKPFGLEDRQDFPITIDGLEFIPTKPKGAGWGNLIKFIYDNLNKVGIQDMDLIISILHDWNKKNKEGETTRYSSLIALNYYKEISKQKIHRDEKLIQIIIYGALEIKTELEEILKEILTNKWKNCKNPYYDISIKILTSFEGLFVAKTLPDLIIKLADLFWGYTPKSYEANYELSPNGEKYFGLEDWTGYRYYPASALQTQIYLLCRISLNKTLDFILSFVNKSVNHYAKSSFSRSVRKVKLFFDDGTTKEQHINDYLWCMYRRTGPYLLQSIHMALEKYLLEYEKNIPPDELERILIYLLKYSESASISAVVTSIVLAYPDKTFNVAKILFKTKEFILQDRARLVSEYQAKSLYSFGCGSNYYKKIYKEERIKTCDDKHRLYDLENIFLYYQSFRTANIGEEEAKTRQINLWKILDNYYNQLPEKSDETEEDKMWRLSLARIDRRKMSITTKKINGATFIQFNPKIDSDLEKYREGCLAKNSECIKYNPLQLWADYKVKDDEKYKEYKKYENNPKQALKEVEEIIEKIKKGSSQEFMLFNCHIPTIVCSVLIKFYISNLSKEEKKICKDIIIKSAFSILNPDYQYQKGTWIEFAISVLPILFKEFPKEKNIIKIFLLANILQPIEEDLFNYLTDAIRKLFTISFDDAQSLLFGYLYFKSNYNNLPKNIAILANELLTDHGLELNKILNNEIIYEELGEYWNLDSQTLIVAFIIIPLGTKNEVHKEIAKKIISTVITKIFRNDRSKNGIRFIQYYTYFVLSSNSEKEILDYLNPLVENFKISKIVVDIFEYFMAAEDLLNTYDNFWIVWNHCKKNVFEICKNNSNSISVEHIIKSYLFANKKAKEWHSIKERERNFFKCIANNIGMYPSTLCSLSKLLNEIGSIFFYDGIYWISDIVKKNKDILYTIRIENDTIYYIEHYIRKYIDKERTNIKKNKDIKNRTIIILDFLVEHNSEIGSYLRESII